MKSIHSHSIYKLASCAALAAIIVGCTPERKNQPGQTSFISYKYDAISEFTEPDSTDSPGARYWRSVGEGVLPQQLGDHDITSLRDTLLSLGKVEFAAKGDAQPVVEGDRRLTDAKPDSVEAENYSLNELEIVLQNTKVIVWKNYVSVYRAGAAHSMYLTTYINYDLKKGRILALDDIFKPGYKKELLGMLKERLSENPDVFSDAEVTVPNDFRITDDGIVFIYGLYEVAPFAAGEIEVEFNEYEIASLLSQEGVSMMQSPVGW